MVRKALLVGAPSVAVAYGVGLLAGDRNTALSAALGVAVVVSNFSLHGLSLAWAAGISVVAVQAVALGGFVLRMGVIVALLFALDRTAFFSPPAFGIAVVIGTMGLLAYEARMVLSGVGGGLDLPPDPAAVRAGEALRLREERR